jgi:hypothetical protein
MLEVEIPEDIKKLKFQIDVLEEQIRKDTNEKDLEIHKAAYRKLVSEYIKRKDRQKHRNK